MKCRTSRLASLAVAAFAGIGCTQIEDVPAPHLASVVPAQASPGTVVSLAGTALCQVAHDSGEEPIVCPNAGAVVFGTAPASATLWSDDLVMAEVPAAGPGSAPVRVTVNGRSSNALAFEIE